MFPMMQNKTLINLNLISYATNKNDGLIDDIKWKTQELFDDHSWIERKKEKICKACYYLDENKKHNQNHVHKKENEYIAKNCIFCGKPINPSVLGDDLLCDDCATKYDACKHCGGVLD